MDWDCLIIGGGAAGAAAATYLARFKRRVLVLDEGRSRLLRIPRSRNAPGYPDGIEGARLHQALLRQALSFGARFESARVGAVNFAENEAGFVVKTEDKTISARTLLVASGIKVTEPPIADLDACVEAGLIRYCPICDGFEVQGKRVAVLGGKPHSIEEARFLTTYSPDVTYVPAHRDAALDGEAARAAEASGIRVAAFEPFSLSRRGDTIIVRYEDSEKVFGTLYPCLGVEPNTHFLSPLKLITDANGAIRTDRHQATNVAGLYAAGDVTDAIDQIATAFGQAAIAATAIHNVLRDPG